MAIIQISKIQQRRGQTAQTNFPQLSSGEFGWSIDQQELYIGNGAVGEGAPAIGNTKIITEHDTNFFLLADNGYTYGNQTVTDAIYRSVQNKLDDIVSLNDFGDVNTVTNHTTIIQNAITYAANIGKPLYFPEGSYNITATIYIPPLAELRGAGSEKTVITNVSTASTFQTLDGNNQSFNDAGFALSDRPRNVRINGFTFVSTVTNSAPVMQLDCLMNSLIEDCDFLGDSPASTQATAVNLRDTAPYPANLTDNVTIKNCLFYNLASAITSNYDIANITITENKFKRLDRGIVLGEISTGLAPQQYGPRHIQINSNTFSNINRQAIVSGSTSTTVISDINSVNNYYYDVGNNQLGDSPTTQATEIIKFSSFGNYSEGDTFDRLTVINASTFYLSDTNAAVVVRPLVAGPVALKSKTPIVYTVPRSNFSRIEMFGYPRNAGVGQSISINYTLTKTNNGVNRQGVLDIMVNGTVATVKDNFTYTGVNDGGINFFAEVKTTKNLVVVYYNQQTNPPGGIITYTFNARQ